LLSSREVLLRLSSTLPPWKRIVTVVRELMACFFVGTRIFMLSTVYNKSFMAASTPPEIADERW
jgi:hypothetical protein